MDPLEHPGFLVLPALLGWVPLTAALFVVLSPRRAVLVALIGGFLFLPVAAYKISGLVVYDKTFAACVVPLLAAAVFDPRRVAAWRPSWFDLPILVFCFSPFISSQLNGYGPHDGVAVVRDQLVIWGAPYLLGRLYFADAPGQRDLAVGIFVGGLVYAPLCLVEQQLSPQLHRWLYGYHPSAFVMTLRFGGYRPMGFMQHGLQLALFMTAASVAGLWLWRTGSLRRLAGVPVSLLAPALCVVAVMCRSMNAVFLLLVGSATLFVTRWLRMPVLLLVLAAAPPAYILARAIGQWSPTPVLDAVQSLSKERALSLQCRLTNEDLLLQKAWAQPWFGWGTWGKSHLFDARSGQDVSITDGLWIIVFGTKGLVGLAAVAATLALPLLALLWAAGVRHWDHPARAPASLLAVLVGLYAIDCIPNAMLNPIYVAAAGGVVGLAISLRNVPVRGQRPALSGRSCSAGLWA